MAAQAGPLCAEPCEGVCWFLDAFDVQPGAVDQEDGAGEQVDITRNRKYHRPY